MSYSPAFVVGCLLAVLVCGAAQAQEGAADLKGQIDELETRLKLADELVELLQKETETLRAENAKLKGEETSAATDSDPFQVGVVWAGQAKTAGNTARWAISIAERNGNKLSGVVAVVGPEGNKNEFPVSGTAPAKGNGLVILESPLRGRAKIFLRGRLINGEIALAFSRTNRLGEKSFGSAYLRPRN